MMNLRNRKLRVLLATALFAVLLGSGAVAVHAQGYCYVTVAHPGGDFVTRWGRFGPYTVLERCHHWITVCN
jgi:hypothetical protein